MMNKMMNTNIRSMELNDNVLDNVIGGIGARPPKRRDSFVIKKLAEFIYWVTEGRFKQAEEVANYDEYYDGYEY